MENDLPKEFFELAQQIIAADPERTSDWTLAAKVDTTELVIPKLDPDGFEVTVIADKEEVIVYAILAHRHFTSNGNHRETAALAMGFARDLLAPNMRLRVFQAGSSLYKASFEVLYREQWENDGTTGLFVFPWFRKRKELLYTNRRYAARNPFTE